MPLTLVLVGTPRVLPSNEPRKSACGTADARAKAVPRRGEAFAGKGLLLPGATASGDAPVPGPWYRFGAEGPLGMKFLRSTHRICNPSASDARTLREPHAL